MIVASTQSTSAVLEDVCRTLAHDLNNILSVILGNLSLAMGIYRQEEKSLRTLARAEQGALKARELAHQLAIYARNGTVTKTECDVAALLRETVSSAFLTTSAPVDLVLPEDLFAIKGDLEQLKQVIRSLIVHCMRGMNSGGVTHIAAANATIQKGGDLPVPPGKYVKISISQRPGIRLENHPEPFEESAPSKAEQSLLALRTIYLLMEKLIGNHGGHLTKETALDQGLTFQLYLPACRRQKVPKPDTAKEEGDAKGRILIMDDEEMVRANVDMILNFLGYDSEFAEDGSQALELYLRAQADNRPFDAVLVDLTIRGGLSGRETVDKLLQIDPKAKAIVFSGHVDDPVVLDFQSFGFKGLIKKPYTLDDFSTVLNVVVH